MTLYEFQTLTEKVQTNILYNRGAYIGKRKENGKIGVLYQLEGFYIEIFYRTYRREIFLLHCFSTTDLLQPYLEEINIEELLKVAG